MTGLLGGTFDPPHNGHVALAQTALERFELERLLVLVVTDPGHREVVLDFGTRLRLAELAFGDLPGTDVVPEEHAFTVDSVRGGHFGDAIFLIGGDEFAAFLSWKEPDAVLDQVRLGVATRPGYPQELRDEVLTRLRRPDRVEFFEMPALLVSSSDIRARIANGESVDGLVPPAVAAEIDRLGLYR